MEYSVTRLSHVNLRGEPQRCVCVRHYSNHKPILTAVVWGRWALWPAVLFAVGSGEVGLRWASAKAHLTAPCGHLGHSLFGLQSLRPCTTKRQNDIRSNISIQVKTLTISRAMLKSQICSLETVQNIVRWSLLPKAKGETGFQMVSVLKRHSKIN